MSISILYVTAALIGLVYLIAGAILETLSLRIDEFDRVENDAVRQRIRAQLPATHLVPRWVWVTLIGVAVVGLCAGPVTLLLLFVGWLRTPRPPIELLLGLGAVSAIAFFILRRVRAALRRTARRLLNEAGYPTCIKCGYDRRGLADVACPECGSPLLPGTTLSP